MKTKEKIIFELTKKMINLVNPVSPRSPNDLSGQSGLYLNKFDKPNNHLKIICLSK